MLQVLEVVVDELANRGPRHELAAHGELPLGALGGVGDHLEVGVGPVHGIPQHDDDPCVRHQRPEPRRHRLPAEEVGGRRLEAAQGRVRGEGVDGVELQIGVAHGGGPGGAEEAVLAGLAPPVEEPPGLAQLLRGVPGEGRVARRRLVPVPVEEVQLAAPALGEARVLGHVLVHAGGAALLHADDEAGEGVVRRRRNDKRLAEQRSRRGRGGGGGGGGGRGGGRPASRARRTRAAVARALLALLLGGDGFVPTRASDEGQESVGPLPVRDEVRKVRQDRPHRLAVRNARAWQSDSSRHGCSCPCPCPCSCPCSCSCSCSCSCCAVAVLASTRDEGPAGVVEDEGALYGGHGLVAKQLAEVVALGDLREVNAEALHGGLPAGHEPVEVPAESLLVAVHVAAADLPVGQGLVEDRRRDRRGLGCLLDGRHSEGAAGLQKRLVRRHQDRGQREVVLDPVEDEMDSELVPAVVHAVLGPVVELDADARLERHPLHRRLRRPHLEGHHRRVREDGHVHTVGLGSPPARVVVHLDRVVRRQAGQQASHDPVRPDAQAREDRMQLRRPRLPPRQPVHVLDQVVAEPEDDLPHPEPVVHRTADAHVPRLVLVLPHRVAQRHELADQWVDVHRPVGHGAHPGVAGAPPLLRRAHLHV